MDSMLAFCFTRQVLMYASKIRVASQEDIDRYQCQKGNSSNVQWLALSLHTVQYMWKDALRHICTVRTVPSPLLYQVVGPSSLRLLASDANHPCQFRRCRSRSRPMTHEHLGESTIEFKSSPAPPRPLAEVASCPSFLLAGSWNWQRHSVNYCTASPVL
jgi:hypothetical protein